MQTKGKMKERKGPAFAKAGPAVAAPHGTVSIWQLLTYGLMSTRNLVHGLLWKKKHKTEETECCSPSISTKVSRVWPSRVGEVHLTTFSQSWNHSWIQRISRTSRILALCQAIHNFTVWNTIILFLFTLRMDLVHVKPADLFPSALSLAGSSVFMQFKWETQGLVSCLNYANPLFTYLNFSSLIKGRVQSWAKMQPLSMHSYLRTKGFII